MYSSLVTRLRGQLSGSGWRGHPAGVVSNETTPTSPLGAASGPNPITVDRWVPRLHPCSSVVPAYWMELGAIGRGGPPIGLAGEPPETLTVSVGLVTSGETRRFPLRHPRKPQEHIVFAQVAMRDIGA